MKKGFTIIELIVVAAIIIVLAGIILAMLSTSRQKGQDAGSKEVLHQIRNALELYHTDHGNYPPPTGDLRINPADMVPTYIPALPSGDYLYDTACGSYDGSLAGELLSNCFVLDIALTEGDLAKGGQCWRDDPVGTGIHDCY